MFNKVATVTSLDNYILLVVFENGTSKKYDIKPLFNKWDTFKSLTNQQGLYELVKVDVGGFGISWNDDIDLSCNELWNNGVEQQSSVNRREIIQMQ